MITTYFPIRGYKGPVMGAVLLALAVPILYVLAASKFEYKAWKNFDARPDLERFYLPSYARSGLRSFWKRSRTQPSNSSFQIFTRKGGMVPAGFTFDPAELQFGTWQLDPVKVHAWLSVAVYRNEPLQEIFLTPLLLFLLALAACLTAAIYSTRRSQSEARNGIHLRGTHKVSIGEFNREAQRSSPREFRGKVGIWFPVGRFGKKIIIPRWMLPLNFSIFGSHGSGKSTLIRWLLYQVEQRGWLAIIYDPKREFAQEFYSTERGDWLIDPTVEDCPYFALEAECRDEIEAAAWAMAFWPDEHMASPFFKKHPRALFAYLISRYSVYNEPENPATCANLGYWLAEPRSRIAPLLTGTELAVGVNEAAKDQSQGLWTTLTEIARALRMMPPTPEGRRTFSVKGWSEKPEGWIFMTSKPTTIDGLRPLHSALLDMLLLSNQQPQEAPIRPIFFILDEVASLQKLPQLESAAAKLRASGNALLLGIQTVSQLRSRYGKEDAQTILAQAQTNIVLRAGDPDSAHYESGLIGSHEVRRYQESRQAGRESSWTEQQQMTPVVMDSEIQKLRPYRGYLVQSGEVVAIRVKKLARRIRVKVFNEREIPTMVFRREPEPTPEPYCESVAPEGEQAPDEKQASNRPSPAKPKPTKRAPKLALVEQRQLEIPDSPEESLGHVQSL